VHEAKDHSPATFERQLAETRAVLGDRLDLYQIHSVTPDSPALTDRALHRLLAELAATGVTVGLSVSGPGQAAAIRAALRVEAGGEPLFHTVQATWNLLEPSAGTALAEAHADGRAVIVKEAMANGRLAARDAEAIGAALAQPWAPLVLSGAATVPQLLSNLRALGPALSSTVDASPSPSPSSSSSLSSSLSASLPAETPEVYWATRSGLAWS
jgi:aryl-alcohol dehydrogenase-like predicted oxidoreductase